MTASIVSFLPIDQVASSSPLYRQIYDGLRVAILKGEVTSGARLPSSRLLATQLAVSRMTVINAYDQLFAEGYLEGRAGSGTFVADKLPEEFFRTGKLSGLGQKSQSPIDTGELRLSTHGRYIEKNRARILKHEGPTSNVAFQHGLPAVRQFPFDIWAKIVQRHYKYSSGALQGYGDPAGYWPLRQAIAAHLRASRAVNCDAGQVIVTSGAQQALHLIAGVLLDRGDKVLIEDPGYLGARDVIEALGTVVVPVPLDDEGLDLDAAKRLGRNARLTYVTPSRQFPTGTTMSLSRRMGLLEWAAAEDGWVVEDDYDSEFRYAGRPLASLQGLDKNGRVLYTGTFSKTIFPGLRLGCLVVPESLVDIFAAARSIIDLHSPLTDQAVLAEFIGEGHFERHLRKMRTLYKLRQEVLVAETRKMVGGMIEIDKADAGMHLVGWLPAGVDDKEVSQKAAASGLFAAPLSNYCLNRPARGGLLLGYTAFEEKEIKRGVRALAKALQ